MGLVLVRQLEVAFVSSVQIYILILVFALSEPAMDGLMFKVKMSECYPVFIKVLQSTNILGKQKAIIWLGGEMEDSFL